jgi:hypothetical protein
MSSLSSKLRNFQKEIIKKKEREREKTKSRKTEKVVVVLVGPIFTTTTSSSTLLLNDEQLISIARYMPRDAESLGKYLSPEQMDAFGEDLLAVTCGHTSSRDQAKFEECLLEIDAFVRGGVPGMALLNRVYPNILKHYCVTDDMEVILETLKLYMNVKENKLKRKWVKNDEENEAGQEEDHDTNEEEESSSRATSQKRQKKKGPAAGSSSQ